MAYQYALPRRDTLTGSDQPGPRAFVVHHTGGGSSAKSIVDYWRANRPGIGTQYIMDRDGNVHSVKDEFGYSGTSHVSGKHTPQDFLNKGLTNKNMLGMEIMAKNDKDVTPKQAKAFAEFMQKNYPNMPIYGHGELNPGHREPDEGQTAKAAAMALRNGGAAAATTGAAPGTADPAVQAGAGPAAVAAARTAERPGASCCLPPTSIAAGTIFRCTRRSSRSCRKSRATWDRARRRLRRSSWPTRRRSPPRRCRREPSGWWSAAGGRRCPAAPTGAATRRWRSGATPRPTTAAR